MTLLHCMLFLVVKLAPALHGFVATSAGIGENAVFVGKNLFPGPINREIDVFVSEIGWPGSK